MLLIKDILQFLDEKQIEYKFIGEQRTKILGFSSLNNYKEDTITWFKNSKNASKQLHTDHIAFAVVQEGVTPDLRNYVSTDRSKEAFFLIVENLFSNSSAVKLQGKGTYISPDVVLGKNVVIGCNCVLDGNITIGDNTYIEHNVTIINSVSIGERCVIQSGVRMGYDGYAYVEDENHTKTMVKHYGGITIGDDVFIGPNTIIDRGTLDNTEIKSGCKIDGLCHISHNSILGENSTLISGTRIYGSVTIKPNADIVSAIVRNQLTIGENAVVGMGAVVTKDVEDNDVVMGIPAKPHNKK